MSLYEQTLAAVGSLDTEAMDRARQHQDRLIKPAGALGDLEPVGAQLAGLAGQCPPPVPAPAGLAIFAGDHGVHQQGVSPWPQSITAAMAGAFASGRAVVNALARQHGVRVRVVDVGLATDLPVGQTSGVVRRRIRSGTSDLSTTAAMTRAEALAAIEVGIDTARELVDAGCRLLSAGDMGIGNTTPSAALIAACTGTAAAEVTGRGTGIDEATWSHKVAVIDRALALHGEPTDPLDLLAALGGFEQAATVGFLLGGAAARVPVILDGIVSNAAALVAGRLAPDVTGALLAGHVSAEPGSRLALAALGLRPLHDLALRLGEGSGAVLAVPLVQAAARVLHEVATLDQLEPSAPPVGRRVLVLGGARSGKSTAAEQMLGDGPATYVATGPLPSADDPEWQQRVRKHQERRPAHWQTQETRDLPAILGSPAREPVLIDCMTTWLAGVMDDVGLWSREPSERVDAGLDASIEAALEAWKTTTRDVVAVSNEVGSGIVPETSSGRLFRDRLGELNARLATAADEVWLVTAGIARRLR